MSEKIDLTGQTRGRWLVLEYAGRNKHGDLWRCRCTCSLGTERVVLGRHLESGKSKSCGCLQRERVSECSKIDLTGQTYGLWLVLNEEGRDKNGELLWRCRCSCGTERVVLGSSLRWERSRSCGCLQRELTSVRMTTHGMRKTRLYRIWWNMLVRAGAREGADEETKRLYQDRGITVCDEWLIFENFRDWALRNGYNDSLELDRTDNDKGYCPENCRWVGRKENVNNRRNTLRLDDGTPLAVFCTEVGIPTRENGKKSPVYNRISKMYRRKRKIHPELLKAANNTIALYRKTLELLKLQEDVKRFAAEVALLSKNEANILP